MEYRDLTTLLLTDRCERILDGLSGAEVYFLPDVPAYLKVRESGKIYDLEREKTALLWLRTRLSVPKVLSFASEALGEALLISEIAGDPASKYVSDESADAVRVAEFVRNAALAMRQIHDIEIFDCPLDRRLDVKLSEAAENVRHGLVDVTDFEEKYVGRTPDEIYIELVKERPVDEDVVLTHGDFCLPNIIVDRGKVSGFVDLGGSGVADRYQDIALFERSFRHNSRVEIDFERNFCETYGLEKLDRRKMEYYRKLDELF